MLYIREVIKVKATISEVILLFDFSMVDSPGLAFSSSVPISCGLGFVLLALADFLWYSRFIFPAAAPQS